MATGARPDYGVDGYPYLVGLIGAGLVGLCAGATLLGFAAGSSPMTVGGSVLLGLGGLALVPGSLGLHYVTRGKFHHRDRLLAHVSWRGDERSLDVGTGGGLMLIGAAKRAPRGSATGIDIWNAEDLSGNTRERVMRNASLEGVAVDVRDEDARKLSFESATFDVVLSVLCFHNIEPAGDRATALRELARVLRPGGIAVVSDLAGIDESAQVLREAGLQVEVSGPWFDTFPFQRVVVARKPAS